MGGRRPDQYRVAKVREAYEDLKKLRQRDRKAWQRANSTIDFLSRNTRAGTKLEGEWAGLRSRHFWQDEYRIIWATDDESKVITIVALGTKQNSAGTIYDRESPDR